jgi:hypothetical protein
LFSTAFLDQTILSTIGQSVYSLHHRTGNLHFQSVVPIQQFSVFAVR